MVTETGNSKEEIILPRPNPVFGNPKFKRIGGSMVPKAAKNNPYFQNIEKSKARASTTEVGDVPK